MGIKIYPHPDDSHIIMEEFGTIWTIEDMFEAVRQVNEIADSVQGTVFLVASMSNISQTPSGILLRGRNALGELHDNVVMTILVTESEIVQTFFKLFNTLFSSVARQKRLHLVRTVEEAYAYINEFRSMNEPK